MVEHCGAPRWPAAGSSRGKCVARHAETGEAIELTRRGFTVQAVLASLAG
ncbi:hypothetical protein HQ560_05410 [bacterium]|nr:hypothetical protein [bacterium]